MDVTGIDLVATIVDIDDMEGSVTWRRVVHRTGVHTTHGSHCRTACTAGTS